MIPIPRHNELGEYFAVGIGVREIERSTQAIRFKDVPMMAAELIEGIGSGDYELHLDVQLPSSVTGHQDRAERWSCRRTQFSLT